MVKMRSKKSMEAENAKIRRKEKGWRTILSRNTTLRLGNRHLVGRLHIPKYIINITEIWERAKSYAHLMNESGLSESPEEPKKFEKKRIVSR